MSPDLAKGINHDAAMTTNRVFRADVEGQLPVEEDAHEYLKHRGGELELYAAQEIPAYLQRPFILTGYRMHQTQIECVRSIFRVHNETVSLAFVDLN